MSLDPVSKIEVVCHSSARDSLVAALEAFGRVHLLDLSEEQVYTDEEGEDLSKHLKPSRISTESLAEDISSLNRAVKFLIEEASEEMEIPSETSAVTEAELMELLADRTLIENARRAWIVAVQKAKLEGAENELLQEEQFLFEWRNIPLPLQELRREGSFTISAGTLPSESMDWIGKFQEENPLVHVEGIDSDRSTARVIVVIHRDADESAFQSLTEAGYTAQDFGSRTGTVTECMGEVRRELEMIRSRTRAIHARALKYAGILESFRKLLDAASLVLERMRAANSSVSTSSIHIFRAWIRTGDLEEIRRRLGGIGEVDVETIEPEEGEVPPSPLTEKPVAEPYRMLTDMYGQPTRKDPDPTPLMAPFYALFFGICIGDAGYGAALAAGAAAGWYMVKKRHGNTRLFKLLFQGGLASILVGVFLGGWFGMPLEDLPGFLRAPADMLNALVPGYSRGQSGQGGFAVSKQFLYVTLALGLLQLTAGIVVNLVKRLRSGEGISAVIDQSGWLLATAGLFPWLFNRYLLEGGLYEAEGPLDTVFMIMLALGAVLIFVMGGREARGFGKVGLGAYATYGIVNLLGDVLSYSRLFALALSSAIIAQVINQMAGMLMEQLGIPVVGLLLATVVVVAGHAFNLAMAALSGFIHTARLQFVEFFGKFYDGTGVPFRPLRYQPKYVHIERNNQQAP
ncbi:MAG: hypothetical protein AVO35_01595 [Candidatus Aegiribacteria sp. MLS_C]|nr:MAG: hypothetical protein AVO35_01595 [Candidatus Aegiribacteria sp. MLS_C]